MNPFEQLLTTQEHDIRLTQLAHKRATLPEHAVVREADEVLVTSQSNIDAAVAELTELERAQRLSEDTLSGLEAKAKEIDRKLYGGTVSNARELQDLQTELESVQRRLGSLEDEALAALERVEPAAAKVEQLRAQHQAVLEVRANAEIHRTAATAEIDAEVEEVTAARAASIQGVPDQVLADYNRLREGLKGVGIARLNRNRCEGCHLTLASAEVDRIKHLDPETVVHCEECGRILVR